MRFRLSSVRDLARWFGMVGWTSPAAMGGKFPIASRTDTNFFRLGSSAITFGGSSQTALSKAIPMVRFRFCGTPNLAELMTLASNAYPFRLSRDSNVARTDSSPFPISCLQSRMDRCQQCRGPRYEPLA